RKPPLHPDVVTYNTLLRSATLLSRNDVAIKVLEKFRSRQENSEHFVTTGPAPPLLEGQSLRRERRLRHPTAQRIQSEQIIVPDFVNTATQPLMRADLYTLSTYITHLVSIGRPDMVADSIFRLLPELHIIDHPATNPSIREWSREERLQRRQECIIRAVKYGPFVFSTLLNALQKAGRTGLAERVWQLARQAERASWMPHAPPDIIPWCLPIEAYTSIMQCYSSESKKGLACIQGTRFSRTLSEFYSFTQPGVTRSPQGRSGKIFVKGWAYFFSRMQAREQGFQDAQLPLRAETARAVGWLLHRTMRKSAISVWQELMEVQPDSLSEFSPTRMARLQGLKFPEPDARFFNVVLDIFGRRPHIQARRIRPSPSWWVRKLRIAQEHYGTSGWLSLANDHALVEVAKEMAQAGHALPLGLRRALVGRVRFRVRRGIPRRHQVRPWAFLPRISPNFQPFTLPVVRTRGLPAGRLN
ncbi:hypothetical protein K439DRAFT_1263072, partial [Ramaria rubella]